MAGHEYSADKNGRITIPYSAQPGMQKIVLVSGNLASLGDLRHEAETYNLQVGFHVEREALLKGRKATLAVRPSLTVSGMPAPLSILEEVALVVSSVTTTAWPPPRKWPTSSSSRTRRAPSSST